MKNTKPFLVFLLMSILVLTQVLMVSAAPSHEEVEVINGFVHSVTLETDPNTGVTTVLITVLDDNGEPTTVRVSEQTASNDLELLDYDDDGNPFIIEPLPESIEIDPASVLPEEEEVQHPVGSALATFFSDIEGVDYETIMDAHEEGNGFGVIAQALWLTRKLGGDSTVFLDILEAKQSGDFSKFTLQDGTTPLNWGQFKKAVLDGDKKGNNGVIMSTENNNPPDHPVNPNGHGNNKEKNKDKNNNGNGNGNGNQNRNRP